MNIQLKNWSFSMVHDKSPGRAVIPVLQGNVYGHPNKRHHDGKFIKTSEIVGKRNGLVVTKANHEYELLTIESGYEKLFPDSKNRLLKQLDEV